MIDAEFSQSKAKFAWTDPKGQLWLGAVDRTTGALSPLSGQGLLVATGTVSKTNMFLWNGPEWLALPSGDAIYFSYYLAGKPPTARNTRMALAVVDSTGDWAVQPMGPLNVPRMADVASTTRDPNAPIMYFDPHYNHYWRNANDASTETLMPFLPAEDKAWRFASGMRAVPYAVPVNGVQQVFLYTLDDKVNQQITFDAGDKDTNRTVPWVFQAPEFNNDFVLTTFVGGNELRVYRRTLNPDGSASWNQVYSVTLPGDRTAGSPQWLTYNGKSYIYFVAYEAPNTFPTEVWISGISAADPLFRRITDNVPFRVRNDPEHFITKQYGPVIFYNRYDPSVDPQHPLCSACSEGVFKADAGLLGR